MHVLPIAQVLGCVWDAASQALIAHLLIGPAGAPLSEENILLTIFKHSKAAPQAVDALGRALGGGHGTPLAIAGSAGTSAGRFCITPLAVLTTEGLTVPQLAVAGTPPALDSGRLPPSGDLNELLDRIGNQLAQCLRQGLRHQGRTALDRMAELARELRAAGLVRCAAALDQAFDAVKGGDAGQLAQRLAALYALLQLLGDEGQA